MAVGPAAATSVRSLVGQIASARLRGSLCEALGPEPTVGQQLNEGAEPSAIEEVEARLGVGFHPALRELFACADGQRRGTPEVLVVPKNRSLHFLSLREVRDLSLYWRERASHPVDQRWWKEIGFNPLWVPVGFAPKFQAALCVSARVGRVLRFTSPEAEVSHSAVPTQHLAESLEDYLQDLRDHLLGVRQPFNVGAGGPMTQRSHGNL